MRMKNINISVVDKVATNESKDVHIVCRNSDYTVTFGFDSEWDNYITKTARFVFTKMGLVRHIDVVFTGNQVAVPVLSEIAEVFVGVFAGDICTTTPARVRCKTSILDGSGEIEEPTPDVYNQILELIQNGSIRGQDGYTPVRGVDYWTETDLAELNGYVQSAKEYSEIAAQNYRRLVEMTEEEFETADKDPGIYYLVYTPEAIE